MTNVEYKFHLEILLGQPLSNVDCIVVILNAVLIRQGCVAGNVSLD